MLCGAEAVKGKPKGAALEPARGVASGLHKGLRPLTLSRDAVERNCILVPRDDSTTDMEVFPMHTPAPIELMNVCLLRDDANRMLVQDRTDPSWPVLCFPGGHVEIGETCADAVVREMQEETGLTVVSPRLVGIKEWMKHGGQTRALVLCYEASAYTGTLTSSAEGENRWMTRAEIAAHPRGKSLLDFLPVYENPDVTSMFYAPDGDGWTAVYR